MTKITPKISILRFGAISQEILNLDNLDEFRQYLNTHNFRVADSPLTYRQVNSLDSNGILNDNRQNKASWRKFSLKELIYLSVIKELRQYGLIDKQLIKLKEAFFSKDYELQSDIALIGVFIKAKVMLIINDENNLGFYTIGKLKLYESRSKSYVNINLNEVINGLFKVLGKETIEYRDELDWMSDKISEFKPSDKEEEILKIIRNKDYKTITIKKNNKVFVIKGEATNTIGEEQLFDMIKNKDFADITILKRDGNFASIKVEDTFKI